MWGEGEKTAPRVALITEGSVCLGITDHFQRHILQILGSAAAGLRTVGGLHTYGEEQSASTRGKKRI